MGKSVEQVQAKLEGAKASGDEKQIATLKKKLKKLKAKAAGEAAAPAVVEANEEAKEEPPSKKADKKIKKRKQGEVVEALPEAAAGECKP